MRPITLACILTCITLTAGPAAALDLNLGTSANVGVDAGSSGLSVGVDASVSADAKAETVGQASTTTETSAGAAASTSASGGSEDQLAPVIRLIESSKWKADAFAKLTAVNGSTYDLGTWVNADNEAELKAALDANAAQIGELHAAIDASAALSAWLKQQGLQSSDVVAIGVTTGGSLAVFTN